MVPITAALIQRMPTGEAINTPVYSAWFGFEKMGVETRSFTWSDLRDGRVEVSRDVAVVGGIEPIRFALEKLGVPLPANVDYPPCLEPLFHRTVTRDVLGGRDFTFQKPIFIKPADGHKLFDGHVVSQFRDLIRTARFPVDTPIWVSDVVEFTSEYRYCVNRGRVVGAGFYRGDATIHPDSEVVRGAVKTFEASGAAPVSYALDFGVLRSGETALVEMNDGFAFGPYGLDPIRHAAMLEDRWCEMVGLPLRWSGAAETARG